GAGACCRTRNHFAEDVGFGKTLGTDAKRVVGGCSQPKGQQSSRDAARQATGCPVRIPHGATAGTSGDVVPWREDVSMPRIAISQRYHPRAATVLTREHAHDRPPRRTRILL